jgi:putative salt-induced outer membrane protein YdiY/sRNA-binding regulator protein Hfq
MLITSMYRLVLCLVTLSIFFVVSEVMADQVVLVNGDTLSGTIEKVAAGKLTLKTDYAGPIDIDISKIKKISTAAPVEVHLQSGEVLKGQLKEGEDGQVIIERSGERETTSVDWKKVASINPPVSKWTGSITLGANSQTGNTRRNGVSLVFDASRKTETDRFSLGYQFNYAHEEDALTARNHYGYIKYDYFFTKRLYGYFGMELLSDTFRDLSLRLAVGPGVGYQVWDDPIKSLAVEGGLSYVNETHKVGPDKDFLAVRLGANFRYKITKLIGFTDKLTLYPRLDNIGRYLLRNEAALTAPVGSGLALRLANILDRDSNPPAGIRKNDVQWILGVQYAF